MAAYFKRTTEELLFAAERRRMKTFLPNIEHVSKCDTCILVINIGTTHGEVLPILFLFRQTIIIEAIFQW